MKPVVGEDTSPGPSAYELGQLVPSFTNIISSVLLLGDVDVTYEVDDIEQVQSLSLPQTFSLQWTIFLATTPPFS